MFLQTLLAVAYKELLQLSRNRAILRSLIILQILDVLAVGWLDTNVRNMPLVVVDQDHTSWSRDLVARIDAAHTFSERYATSSTEQARSHIRAGRAKIALVIPYGYGRRRSAHEPAEILTLVDGSDEVASSQATSAIDGVAAQMNVEIGREVLTEERPRGVVEARSLLLFNPQGSTAFFMLPGLLALLVSGSYMARTLTLAQERESGHLDRLLMTPMSYLGLMFGKLVPHFVAAVLNAMLYLLALRWIFGVPVQGSVVLLFVGTVFYVLTVLSAGLFVAANAKSAMDAVMTLNVFTVPATMLTGYIFPLASLPKWVLPVAYAMPETHFIEITRGICLRGAGFVDLAPYFVVLAVAPVLLLIGAARRFARSIGD
jgi:ABC-2 type transport system permease protein